MLQSFVSEEDYPKLISLLKKICNGTIKDDVALILVSGGPNSGKTTLMKIMSTLSKTSGRFSVNNLNSKDTGALSQIGAFQNQIVISDEIDTENKFGPIDTLTVCLKFINEGLIVPQLFKNALGICKPGTLIIPVEKNYNIDCKKVESWSRNILPETIWGGFDIENPVNFVDSPDEKRPRYPINIHLPNTFKYNSSIDFEAIALVEFHNILLKEYK